MAKVSCNYMNKINLNNLTDLNKPFVFVVDMINGFVKEGALADPSIMEIVPAIQNLLKNVYPSVFICDSHDLDACEFNSYPVHCIKNTYESAVIDELKPFVRRTVLKNSTNAFFGDGMREIIEEELDKYNDIIIVGCCSDICILQFALTLKTYFNQHQFTNKRIIVPINMIETYHIDDVHNSMKYNEIACDLMQSNGIEVIELK